MQGAAGADGFGFITPLSGRPLAGMGGKRHHLSEPPARRISHHADAVGVDLKVGGVGSEEPERGLAVHHLGREPGRDRAVFSRRDDKTGFSKRPAVFGKAVLSGTQPAAAREEEHRGFRGAGVRNQNGHPELPRLALPDDLRIHHFGDRADHRSLAVDIQDFSVFHPARKLLLPEALLLLLLFLLLFLRHDLDLLNAPESGFGWEPPVFRAS